tara:strand:- start:87 stop:266 length:180 start_codon:yes stop_codon:yes gene_type:complete
VLFLFHSGRFIQKRADYSELGGLFKKWRFIQSRAAYSKRAVYFRIVFSPGKTADFPEHF